jgi:16S rRNA processing protein RimM
MKKEPYYPAGKILRSLGVKGELVVSLYEPGLFVNFSFEAVFLNPGRGLVPFFVDSFSFNLPKNTLLLRMEGIDSPASAGVFVGQEIFLDSGTLPEPETKQFFAHEVLGFELVDKNEGPLGPVLEVLDLPMQQVFRLMKDGCEILIPAVPEIILSIDRVARTIQIEAPEGLIDLYLSQTNEEEE